MPFTKDIIVATLQGLPGPEAGRTLGAPEHLLMTSLCDTFIALKMRMAAGTPAVELSGVGASVRRALSARGESLGTRLDSLVIEFVDERGKVLQTEKFGGLSAASAGPSPSSDAGHAPIGGLGPSPARTSTSSASHAPSPQGAAPSLPGVRRVIAVGAGKGGVGKSTIALNLAVGLARRGHAVGLLDGDIYGPSMPTMLGLADLDATVHQGRLQPFYVHGIKCMTIGKLVDPEKPLIWRGPMAHGAFKQLTEQTEWGDLDYLIIDLPPGTGDVSLTMAQLIRLTGAVLVCTPQRVAQDDCVRAAKMFQQLSIEVLGVVENMSYFVGDDGKTYDIFGRGGAEKMAARLNLPFLGACPITMSLRKNSDGGDPTSNFTGREKGDAGLAAALERIVTGVEDQAALAEVKSGNTRPTLKIT